MAARSGLGNGPLGRRRRRVGLATKKKRGGESLFYCDAMYDKRRACTLSFTDHFYLIRFVRVFVEEERT